MAYDESVMAQMREIIERSIRVKADVVADDLRDHPLQIQRAQ